MNNYIEWAKFGFVWGGITYGIIGVLSLILGALLLAINPVFSIVSFLGILGSIIVIIFGGVVGSLKFLIGRFFYKYLQPYEDAYERVVAVLLLGTAPSLLISILNIFIRFLSSPSELVLYLIGLGISIFLLIIWSLIFTYIWKDVLKYKVPT